jgi:hypothetical protein
MKLLHVIILSSLIFFQSCLYSFIYLKEKKVIVELNGVEYNLRTPPNGVEISHNFFVDQTEISNIHWKEFEYWISTVYGENSEEYLSLKLAQNLWSSDSLGSINLLDDYYSSSPVYDDYPVIGLTFEQALKYSRWRSDRVYEMLLIKAGILENNLDNMDSLNSFTIENYINGRYFNKKPNLEIPVPIYTLPTIEQWELFATNIKEIEDDEKGNKKKSNIEFATYEAWLLDSSVVARINHSKYFDSKTELIHTIGNVSEMTLTKGISKGGSWKHKLQDCYLTQEFKYSEPSNWLGFRNVCSFYPASAFLE